MSCHPLPAENEEAPANTLETTPSASPSPVSPNVIVIRSRSGASVVAPDYLRYD